jgi:hypothetical protein
MFRRETDQTRSRLSVFSSGSDRHPIQIRADMRCVAKINFGFLPLRQGLDLRVLFLQPLLDQGFVALQGAMQRLFGFSDPGNE